MCETRHKSSAGVHRNGTTLFPHRWQIKIQNSLIILSLLFLSQPHSSTEHMWISFWVYHMLKHNYVCVKLVRVLCIPLPHLIKESAKAEILPSIICPSELYFLASTMTPHPLCQDTGHMNKRDFFEVHSKNKPHDNTDYFFTAQIIRQEKSQTNGLNGTSPSLWAEGKYKNKMLTSPMFHP